jgi:phosphate transport system substrate-binding protein
MVLCFVLLVTAGAASAATDIKVNVDGSALNMDVAPLMQEGRVLVPFRFIAENLGGLVSWDEASQTVKIVTADKTVSLPVGQTTATVNGEAKTLDVSATLVDGRTLVPVRFVSESLGADVTWDDANQTVNVNYFSTMTGTLKVGGSTTVFPIAQASADYLQKFAPGISITVTGGGSGVGTAGAKDGTLNVGMQSSDLKQADKDAGLVPVSIGKDAIVVIVNNANSVQALTREQIKKIFSGETKNWQDVGGANAPIVLHTREAGSGTLDGFDSMIMKKEAPIDAIAEPHNSNPLMKQAVANDPNAIGFLSLGHLDTTVKGLVAEGVTPTEANASTGAYPFVRNLWLSTKGTASGQAAKFINFVRSVKGQQILASEDYIPLR